MFGFQVAAGDLLGLLAGEGGVLMWAWCLACLRRADGWMDGWRGLGLLFAVG